MTRGEEFPSEGCRGGSGLALADISVLPIAACMVKCDEYFTMVWANEAFYELMGCTPEEMGFRYASRLSALWNQDAVGRLVNMAQAASAPSRSAKFHHRVVVRDEEREFETMAFVLQQDEGPIICCLPRDCTHEMRLEAELGEFMNLGACVAATAGFEAFSYDAASRMARIIFSSSLLEPVGAPGTTCPDFPGAMLRAGLVHPEDVGAFEKAFSSSACSGVRCVCDLRLGGPSPDTGQWRWYRLTLAGCENPLIPGRSSGGGVFMDITEHKELAMTYLNETQFYYAMLAEETAYAHLDATDDVLIKVGGMWNLYNELISTTSYSDIVGSFMDKVVHPDDRAHYSDIMRCENFVASLENGIDRVGCEFRRIADQNKMVWMEFTAHLLKDPITHHVLALLRIRNIDKKKRQELMLQSSSERDPLTRILHKKSAETAIRERLRDRPPGRVSAFMILDVDDFKDVNDRFGHEAGDRALLRFVDAISRCIDRLDVLGRFGGDEFILYVDDARDEDHIAQLLEDMFAQLRHEVDPPITCSVGVTLLSGESSYETAFSQADAALYLAKDEGKDTYVFHRAGSSGDAGNRLSYVQSKVAGNAENEGRAADAPFDAFSRAEGVADASAPGPLLATRGSSSSSPSASGEDAVAFAQFLSEQGEMAYLVNPDTFTLICGNEAFYERIGETASSCLGMKCYEAMHRRTSPCPFCSKANWSTDKFFMWRNDNESLEQEFLLKNKLVNWKGREALLAIAVDISNNKSIVDSLDNGTSEGHHLLAGIQQMSAAKDLAEVIHCALEAIGRFFRSDSVRLWSFDDEALSYQCVTFWSRDGVAVCPTAPDDRALDSWLAVQQWEEPVLIESPESVMRSSFVLYQYMRENSIDNARWVVVRDDQREGRPPSYISVENLTANLQNVAFLERFPIFVVSEVRKRRMMENLLYASSHDELTGVLNREGYERCVAAFDADLVRCVGVVSANVNNMKQVNSAKGFAEGNYYLKQFAFMLTNAFSEENVYRLNGDEFAVIAPNLSREELERRIGDMREVIEGNGLFTVAIGCSWDDVEKNLEVLTNQAVAAMEADKRRFHDKAQDVSDDSRRKALRGIVSSIENGNFLVYLQPKVDLSTRRTVGAEALIRYRDASGNIVPPGRFIPALEENGLVRHADLFVLEQVTKLLERWKREERAVPVSVNLSRRTVLESDVIPSIEGITSRYDIDRSMLEIEITESFGTVGRGVLYQVASELLRVGFSLSLDDFGTKYTDLSILSSISFHVVKLDKSLIDTLADDKIKQTIVRHIVGMCFDLGVDVIAEGIETPDQETMLQGLGCHLGQGYLYSRPVPLEDFERGFLPRL